MTLGGTIFHHEEFVFKDGEIGNKLLVLLNTPHKNESYLIVKTTSQDKGKPKNIGCIEKLSLFFVPPGPHFFSQPTWIQLHEIYEFSHQEFKADSRFKTMGSLNAKLLKEIIDCIFISQPDDILPTHENLLRPPLEKSLQKLKERFQKKVLI